MSDIRDERHDDAAAFTVGQDGTASAPETHTPQTSADAQPTLPYGPTGFENPLSQTQPTVPLAAPGTQPAMQNPYGPQPTSGAQPAANPFGAQAAPQDAVAPQFGASQHPQPAAMGATGHHAGGHSTHERYGAAFGSAAASATGAQQPAQPIASAPAPRKRSSAGVIVGAVLAAALVGGAAGLGGAAAGNALWGGNGTTVASGPQTVTINNPDKVSAVTAVAAAVTPSVVTIAATDGQSGGSGSGVVLSKDGYVLTNTHVVTLDGATGTPTLRVTTSDGRIFDAKVVGTDPLYDLAVIKIEGAEDLTPIEFADSSKLNVGDQTIAVGAPLGLENTVTTGIVSALNRSIQIASSAAPADPNTQVPEDGQGGQGPFQFNFPDEGEQQQQQTASGSISIAVIQTDAAINPGNSGGALVDAEGKLIGINVAIASAGGSGNGQSGNIGVGFSIPSNIAERVSQEIIENGAATHGLLGATVISAEALEDATLDGAAIEELSAGGAAEKAGLKAGDVVTNFNGNPITSSIDLTAQVRALAGGAKAELTYVRDGKQNTVTVTLGDLKG